MFLQDIQKLKKEKRIIRIALVGTGQMGRGLICQCEQMGDYESGLQVVAVFSRTIKSCESAYHLANINPQKVKICHNAASANREILSGSRTILTSAAEICQIKEIDLVIEATGTPSMGAYVALLAIENSKHIIQMNVEADATVGYILRKKAKQAGVIYTLASGDEPGSIMELYDFAKTLGFHVICAGKGKNNPINHQATPSDTSIQKKAKQYAMSPSMLCSFVDGTKTMVEMCSLGNAIGFTPICRGMKGYTVSPSTIAQVYQPIANGGVLEKESVLDFAFGIAPGVFIIIYVEHPKILLDLQYLALGEGPYYALYRPYHLVSLEVPISILRCMVHGQTTLATDNIPCNESLIVAKKALAPQTQLGQIGRENYYGSIDTRTSAQKENLLPLGLAGEAILQKKIQFNQYISYSDVTLNQESTIVQLR